ncbi:MAG: hypothetical protein ACHQF4_04790 [Sphingobacteriales bacterium]
MKTSFYLTAFCIIFLSVFLVWKKFEVYDHSINISVSENFDSYHFSANYNPENTGRVQDYINSSIAPNGLFRSENDYMDINTTLSDKTNFYIKESPGRVKITIDKRKNSFNSYMRIKKMCEGIKGLLAGK